MKLTSSSILAASLLVLTFAATAQKGDHLVRIAKEGLRHSASINFITDTNVLQIDSLLIPCSKNSIVKLKSENNEYRVEFFLQRNTSIRNTNDASFRRAWLALPFQSRKSAKEFITAFQKISHSHQTKSF
ncbi:MAG: hypothetical protein ACK5PC_22805 [Cyclobacteriaceae bacterium]|jgi:hypothetical protein|nr:hypothetical protein [Flammeovirgaceae bacterium]